jgi:hypothetical protein
MAAASWVHVRGIRVGSRYPSEADNADMSSREAKAPEKTMRRGWRIANKAAMRNVLSPISETRIRSIDCTIVSKVGESAATGSDGEEVTDIGVVVEGNSNLT